MTDIITTQSVLDLLSQQKIAVKIIESSVDSDKHWKYNLRQLADPEKVRPVKKLSNLARRHEWVHPATGQVTPRRNRTVREPRGSVKPGATHTKKTDVTLAPPDGVMQYFNLNNIKYPVGMLFNIDLCQFKKCDAGQELYVFNVNANTNIKWWVAGAYTGLPQYVKSISPTSLAALRQINQEARSKNNILSWNNLLVGLSKESVMGVVLPSFGQTADRLNALYRKLLILKYLNKDVPIIFMGPNQPAMEYSAAQIAQDLQDATKYNTKKISRMLHDRIKKTEEKLNVTPDELAKALDSLKLYDTQGQQFIKSIITKKRLWGNDTTKIMTILLTAVQYQRFEVVHELLQRNIRIDEQSVEGQQFFAAMVSSDFLAQTVILAKLLTDYNAQFYPFLQAELAGLNTDQSLVDMARLLLQYKPLGNEIVQWLLKTPIIVDDDLRQELKQYDVFYKIFDDGALLTNMNADKAMQIFDEAALDGKLSYTAKQLSLFPRLHQLAVCDNPDTITTMRRLLAVGWPVTYEVNGKTFLEVAWEHENGQARVEQYLVDLPLPSLYLQRMGVKLVALQDKINSAIAKNTAQDWQTMLFYSMTQELQGKLDSQAYIYDANNYTPLHHVIVSGNTEVIDKLNFPRSLAYLQQPTRNTQELPIDLAIRENKFEVFSLIVNLTEQYEKTADFINVFLSLNKASCCLQWLQQCKDDFFVNFDIKKITTLFKTEKEVEIKFFTDTLLINHLSQDDFCHLIRKAKANKFDDYYQFIPKETFKKFNIQQLFDLTREDANLWPFLLERLDESVLEEVVLTNWPYLWDELFIQDKVGKAYLKKEFSNLFFQCSSADKRDKFCIFLVFLSQTSSQLTTELFEKLVFYFETSIDLLFSCYARRAISFKQLIAVKGVISFRASLDGDFYSNRSANTLGNWLVKNNKMDDLLEAESKDARQWSIFFNNFFIIFQQRYSLAFWKKHWPKFDVLNRRAILQQNIGNITQTLLQENDTAFLQEVYLSKNFARNYVCELLRKPMSVNTEQLMVKLLALPKATLDVAKQVLEVIRELCQTEQVLKFSDELLEVILANQHETVTTALLEQLKIYPALLDKCLNKFQIKTVQLLVSQHRQLASQLLGASAILNAESILLIFESKDEAFKTHMRSIFKDYCISHFLAKKFPDKKILLNHIMQGGSLADLSVFYDVINKARADEIINIENYLQETADDKALQQLFIKLILVKKAEIAYEVFMRNMKSIMLNLADTLSKMQNEMSQFKVTQLFSQEKWMLSLLSHSEVADDVVVFIQYVLKEQSLADFCNKPLFTQLANNIEKKKVSAQQVNLIQKYFEQLNDSKACQKLFAALQSAYLTRQQNQALRQSLYLGAIKRPIIQGDMPGIIANKDIESQLINDLASQIQQYIATRGMITTKAVVDDAKIIETWGKSYIVIELTNGAKRQFDVKNIYYCRDKVYCILVDYGDAPLTKERIKRNYRFLEKLYYLNNTESSLLGVSRLSILANELQTEIEAQRQLSLRYKKSHNERWRFLSKQLFQSEVTSLLLEMQQKVSVTIEQLQSQTTVCLQAVYG